jgi:type IV pilus assembly protein PilE
MPTSGSSRTTNGRLHWLQNGRPLDNRDMHHSAYRSGSDSGFTLIELVITLAVLAILAVIAVPSYQDSMRKGRRADALAGLNRLQQAQEQFRANNPAYASAAASLPGGTPAESPERHYALAVDPAASSTATTYSMTATAKTTSPQFADTRCRTLRVTMNAGTIGHTSFDAAATEDTTNANRCWPQ